MAKRRVLCIALALMVGVAMLSGVLTRAVEAVWFAQQVPTRAPMVAAQESFDRSTLKLCQAMAKQTALADGAGKVRVRLEARGRAVVTFWRVMVLGARP